MRIQSLTLLPLLAAWSVEGRSYQSAMAPRSYQFSRGPAGGVDAAFDLVSEIFSMPLYANSLMRQQVDSQHSQHNQGDSMSPPHAVNEDPDTGTIELLMEVPGVLAENLSVELEDDKVLRIRGSRTSARNGSVVESKFDQVFTMDKDVDPNQMKVTLSAGILRVTAPKREQIIKVLPVETEDTEYPAAIEANVVPGESSTAAAAYATRTPPVVEEVDGMTISTDDAPVEEDEEQ